jgi:hypothetical protein
MNMEGNIYSAPQVQFVEMITEGVILAISNPSFENPFPDGEDW